jgi:hypothetical protein
MKARDIEKAKAEALALLRRARIAVTRGEGREDQERREQREQPWARQARVSGVRLLKRPGPEKLGQGKRESHIRLRNIISLYNKVGHDCIDSHRGL